jgi:hypothetical protein
MPFPDFTSLPTDLRLYRNHGVHNVFVQGTFVAGGGQCDAELRAWVLSRLLWNPDADAEPLVSEWLQGVYGAAWKPMCSWFDRLHREASDAQRHLYLQDRPLHAILSDDVLAAGDSLFDTATQLAGTDAARDAIAKARLSLQYVQLDRARVPGDELDHFLATSQRFGLTHVAEGRPLEDWAAEVRRRGE